MSQPPGWPPQQPYAQRIPHGQPMPYGQATPGMPQYPPVPPGYPGGGHPRRSSPALAYVAAALFLPAVVMAFVSASIGWNGPEAIDSEPSMGMFLSLTGLAFSDDLTGNVDFAVATTMTVACTTATLMVAMAFRLNAVRWLLAVIGVIVTAYYVYVVIDLLTDELWRELIVLPLATLLLWTIPTVVVMLPPVGRAMRGREQSNGPGGHPGTFGQGPPVGYGPGY